MTTASPKASQETGSFFRPYKQGQGFWTRLGTGIGAALIILFTIQFLYQTLPAWVRTTSQVTATQAELDELRAQGRGGVTRVMAAEPAGDVYQVTLEHIWLSPRGVWLYVVLGAVALALGVLSWWLINRPKHAEFLINTDGEMKKVNWTTRRELIGSTKVVISFMFFIAAVLFVYDLIFGHLFFLMNVIKIAPFTTTPS